MKIASTLSNHDEIPAPGKTAKPGATTTHAAIQVSMRVTIRASITNDGIIQVGIAPAHPAFAVMKARDVMGGVRPIGGEGSAGTPWQRAQRDSVLDGGLG